MNSAVAISILVTVLTLAFLGSCVKPNDSIVQTYRERHPIQASDTGNPDYSSRVMGSVFIAVYLDATESTTYTGRPPFSIALGAYSISNTVVRVEIVSASVSINDGQLFDISSHFGTLSLNTVRKDASLDPAIYSGYSSAWIETDKFLNAIPLDGDTVRVVFELKVGDEDSSEVRKMIFEFVPETHPAPPRGLPA